MKSMHVLAAIIALCMTAANLTALLSYADAFERVYIHALALADTHPDIVITGIALQKAALDQSDLLPIYGASEDLIQTDEYQAAQFFRTYPTGFAPFEISHLGSRFIIHAEAIAALGSAIQGKKVVLSFSPEQFFDSPGQFTTDMMDAKPYSILFSRLHANELTFNSNLSYETRQRLARRMLQYPDTLESDPLLKFAVEQLASDTLLSRIGRAHV